jgi:hypothetical protein
MATATLRQRSFGRRSLDLLIADDRLDCATSGWFYRHTFSVRLAEIDPRFEEWNRVAISWYLVAAAAVGFLGYTFRDGWHGESLYTTAGSIYLVLAVYSILRGWQTSGSYALVRAHGENPRVIWIMRTRPNRETVDSFLAAFVDAINARRQNAPVDAR